VTRKRLTAAEWAAIEAALGFVLAGEDPWESDDEKDPDGFSKTWTACKSAYEKLGLG
jgi:hypothetical protein